VAVRFEWDKNKNRSNLAKHGIEFDAAVGVFADPNSVMRFDREIGDERRWQTIGRIPGGPLVVLVVHTLADLEPVSALTDDIEIRIISARKATPRERRLYEEGDWND